MNTKYFWLILILIGMASCSEETDGPEIVPPPALEAGSADFSNYVAVGDSQTAGFTDGALFMAGQLNSMPNILSQNMSTIGGGSFNQPMTSDNIGGMLYAGNLLPLTNRFYFDLTTFLPAILPGTPTTDVTNVLSGNFNNMGVPGAKSFHLVAPGYGSVAGVPFGLSSPYFARFASSGTTTILTDAMAQGPSFFTLWVGSLDVTAYALAGGDGVNQEGNFDPRTYGFNDITDSNVFGQTINGIVGALASTGAQGVIANIPNPLLLPYFHVIDYNPIPLDANTAALLNLGYVPYNGGLLQMELGGAITETERIARTIQFVEGDNAVVMIDEYLTDLSGSGLPSMRQTTEQDFLTLPAQFILGTIVGGNPQLINGLSVPLEDEYVLSPNEQEEVDNATATFNAIIKASADQFDYGFADIEMLMVELASTGVQSGDFRPTSQYTLGGAISLDGVHTNARGNALVANEILKVIDSKYGSNFMEADAMNDLGDYPTNYPPNLP